ncbi:hypothetical protein D9611_009636 [Ephemerocybe angulata]|uniref:O-methyltransferase domain-containing protein n=1 Tax=Ephemerocybe angulata TaxID=980116 RepID=A0A8H5C635_9AGAR|nr:hypothetical protein D9611_009636 [Tulosesus angulatus]
MDTPQSPDMLLSLACIISDSVNTIHAACEETGLAFPKLEDAFDLHSEAFRPHEGVSEATKRIVAAAHQLIAAVLPPATAVYTIAASGSHKAACLRICLEENVAEILREAGPKGLHVSLISQRTNINPQKLARILRFMATLHIFKELSPDVFTNNRLSSAFDTGKPVDELLSNRAARFSGTNGFTALACLHLDDIFKGSAYLWETLSDPLTSESVDAKGSACSHGALGYETNIWEFMERPEQAHRLRRFGEAIRGVQAMEPTDAVLEACDWKALPEDSVVVDVGGGVGASVFPLAKYHPHLRLIVQDRQDVVEQAKEVWLSKDPAALGMGRVTLQGHDFFESQPVRNASVFLLKQVIHDWSDKDAVRILSGLREASQPTTKLVIIDCLINHACSMAQLGEHSSIPGAIPREAPLPLLANYGAANFMSYFHDITMLTRFNSQERTVAEFSSLLKMAGWRLVRVRRTDGADTFLQPLEAVPA